MKSFIIALIISTQTLFANGGSGGFDMMQLIPFGLMFVIFYFLLLRPQQKKAKAHQDMLKELRAGDHVVTAGGILGTVDKVSEREVSIEIANNVKIRVIKATITEVLNKTQLTNKSTDKTSTDSSIKNKEKPESKPKTKKVAKAIAKPANKKTKK